MSEKSTAVQTAPTVTSVRLVEPQTLLDRANRIYEGIARRAFELFESGGGVPGRDVEHWLQAEAELLRPVRVSISESGEALTVQAEIPGFRASDLQVSLDGRRLTISGKKETSEEQKKGKTVYREQSSSEILRVIDLPADADISRASATLTHGVLELTLPKVVEAKAAREEAKGAQAG